MRTYATILVLLLTVPAYAVDAPSDHPRSDDRGGAIDGAIARPDALKAL